MLFRFTTCFAVATLVGTLFAAEETVTAWRDTLPDYSRAGYGGGGVRLPDVPVRVTLHPLMQDDDGVRIQAALDEGGRLPADSRGLRGAVMLKSGTYQVADSLVLKTGGVVLRGEGDDQTTIIATGTRKRTLIEVGDPRARRVLIGKALDERGASRLPAAEKRLDLRSVEGLHVGDRVLVRRPSTAEWISVIGIDRMPNRPGAKDSETRQWKPGEYDLEMERTITSIEGRRVTLDAPLMMTIESRFGRATVHRFRLPRIAECGVECLRLVSAYAAGREDEDEEHAWIAIELHAVENAWVRDVTIRHFSHAVQTNANAIFTTIQDSRHLDPVSRLAGG